MSQVLFSKVLIDRSELNKLKEYEKQIKAIHAERKKDLQIKPPSKELENLEEKNKDPAADPLNENTIEQSGSGVVDKPTYNETLLCEQLIHKISEAVIQQLRYLKY